MGALSADEPTTGRKYTCKVASIMAAVDEEDRAAIERHMADPAKSTRAISRWLTKHGMPINETTVSDHRRGDCACFR